MKILPIILGAFLAPACIWGAEFPLPEYKSVAPGAWYGVVRSANPDIVYHVVKVEADKPALVVRPIRPRKEETMEELAARLAAEKTPLLAGITGDYFNYVREYGLVLPWGILVAEGKLIFSPEGKSAFCAGPGGPRILVPEMEARVRNRSGLPGIRVAAVNRPADLEGTDCALFNSQWGDSALEIPRGFAVTVMGESDFRIDRPIGGKVAGICRLPVKVPVPDNGYVLIVPELPPADQLDLKLGSPMLAEIGISTSPRSAIGGGPRIVRAGRVSVEMERENFSPGRAFYIKNSRHPRSAVGIGPGGKYVYLVVVEGRSEESRGMNLRELGDLLLLLGADEAMAFDGGRSVSLYVDGRVAVEGDRQMADALGVFRVAQ